MVSLPTPPSRVSFPANPNRLSLPSKPSSWSLLGVPVMISLPDVPMIMLLILRVKTSLTVAPALSVAVTAIFRLPTSLLVGVPLKVRVVELKVNQLGKAFPFSNVAEYLTKSGMTFSFSSVFLNVSVTN